jgi:uncharacterized cupredoxin-like copper-binding protein
MMRSIKTGPLTILTIQLFLAGWSTMASAHEHHSTYSAGEPGDPKKPSRTIEIAMNEMEFDPYKIEVKRGEQIRFVLRNVGTEDHEFLLATTKENLKHAELMKKHPHMEHDDPNGVRVAPKKTFVSDPRPPRIRHDRSRRREVKQRNAKPKGEQAMNKLMRMAKAAVLAATWRLQRRPRRTSAAKSRRSMRTPERSRLSTARPRASAWMKA